jgi:hypothetical protein
VADLLVETLQAAGVKTCYGIVGDTMNRIAHAIDRSEIDWVHVRQRLTDFDHIGICSSPRWTHSSIFEFVYQIIDEGARRRLRRSTRREHSV